MVQETGKYTVITGASSGIGYETAKAFAERGKNLAIAAKLIYGGISKTDMRVYLESGEVIARDLASVYTYIIQKCQWLLIINDN